MHQKLIKLPDFLGAAILLCLLTAPTLSAGLAPGTQAPDFKLNGLLDNSQPLALADYRGKVVYVDFWASWCGPCRKSLPQLNALRAELSESGFEVIAINVDEFEEDALEFINRYPVDYPLVRDPRGETAKLYKVRGMPTSYLVDKQGQLTYIHEGFRDGDIEEIRAKIDSLLKH